MEWDSTWTLERTTDEVSRYCGMSLPASESYAQLLDKARWSHANGRNVFHILQTDVDAARLFSYGYRSQPSAVSRHACSH